MRLLHQHFGADPATLGEDPFRNYILHVKTRKAWKPCIMPDGPRPQGSAPQKAAHPQPVLRSPDVPALAPGSLLGFRMPAAIVQPTSRVITTVRTWPENGRFQTDGNGPDPSRTRAGTSGSTQPVIHESDPEEVAMALTPTEMAPNKAIRTANRGFESDRPIPLGANRQT